MISMDKQYRTRDGRQVRVYAVEPHEVHGAVMDDIGWNLRVWHLDGGHHCANLDLIEVRPKRTLDVWVNVYSQSCLALATKNAADRYTNDRIACLHIVREYEEGEGL